MAENDTLTASQKRAIAALLAERDVRSAAAAAGVSERTLWRWLELPAFRAELKEQEGAIIDQVTRGLLILQGEALDELRGLLTNQAVSPAVRLQAVRTALEYSVKFREMNELEQRISTLEKAAKNERTETES